MNLINVKRQFFNRRCCCFSRSEENSSEFQRLAVATKMIERKNRCNKNHSENCLLIVSGTERVKTTKSLNWIDLNKERRGGVCGSCPSAPIVNRTLIEDCEQIVVTACSTSVTWLALNPLKMPRLAPHKGPVAVILLQKYQK